jgi:hypothetical protein
MGANRIAAFLFCLLLTGCAAVPSVRMEAGFTPPPPQETIYVVPFTTIMVPVAIEEGVFDLFVDTLIAGSRTGEYEVVILKEGTSRVDPEWLKEHNYVTGEVFAYVEESGCCSTAIRLRSRLQVHQPGSDRPTLTLDYPRETFFEHDYSTVETERKNIAEDVARTLATRLLDALSGR